MSSRERSAIAEEARRKYRQITDVYWLEFELPADVDRPREWKLELVPDRRFKTADFRVTYPRKLLPCQAANTR